MTFIVLYLPLRRLQQLKAFVTIAMSSIKDRIAALNKKNESPEISSTAVAPVRPKRATVGDIAVSEPAKPATENAKSATETADKPADEASASTGAPMSVKERLALLKTQNEPASSAPTPAPAVRTQRATVSDITLSEPVKPATENAKSATETADKPADEASASTGAPMSVKERLALLKTQNEPASSAPTPAPAVRTQRATVAGITTASTPSDAAPPLSVKERLAQMKAQGAEDSVPSAAEGGGSDVPGPRRTSKLDPSLLGKVNMAALVPGGARPSFALPGMAGPPMGMMGMGMPPGRARAVSASAASESGEMVHVRLTQLPLLFAIALRNIGQYLVFVVLSFLPPSY
jgi:hypothetical protein